MRISTAYLAFLFSVHASAVIGQSLAHELYVDSLDCESEYDRYPRNSKEMSSVHIEWLSETDLKVSFWQQESTDEVVRRTDSTAKMHESTLALAVETLQTPQPAGGPYAACSWPAWVTFIIHGAIRGAFEIEILGKRVPRADIVGG